MFFAALAGRGIFEALWRLKGVLLVLLLVGAVGLTVWRVTAAQASLREQVAEQRDTLALKELAIERLGERAVVLHQQALAERSARESAERSNARLADRLRGDAIRARQRHARLARQAAESDAVRAYRSTRIPAERIERLRAEGLAAPAAGVPGAATGGRSNAVRRPPSSGG